MENSKIGWFYVEDYDIIFSKLYKALYDVLPDMNVDHCSFLTRVHSDS